jgi:glyoxylase-like metal-dependent hydrolase (beta-lactamase superfamily II)
MPRDLIYPSRIDPVPDIVQGVHGLGSKLVNWYIVEDGGRLTAVDAGLPAFAKRLEPDLAALAHVPGDIEAVVLTHSDADHTGLVPTFRAAGAHVLVHTADEATLAKPGPKSGDGAPLNLVRELWRPPLWRMIAEMVRGGAARMPKIEGAETFGDGDVLDVPGEPRVIATPGHTPGHCALVFEKHGALFVGDELCMYNPLTGELGPRVMPKPFNVSTDQCYDSLAALENLKTDVVLPGHGQPWRGGAASAVARARATR